MRKVGLCGYFGFVCLLEMLSPYLGIVLTSGKEVCFEAFQKYT